MNMIFEALASFNQWYFDLFIKNAGYWMLVMLGILIPLKIANWRLKKKEERKWKAVEKLLGASGRNWNE